MKSLHFAALEQKVSVDFSFLYLLSGSNIKPGERGLCGFRKRSCCSSTCKGWTTHVPGIIVPRTELITITSPLLIACLGRGIGYLRRFLCDLPCPHQTCAIRLGCVFTPRRKRTRSSCPAKECLSARHIRMLGAQWSCGNYRNVALGATCFCCFAYCHAANDAAWELLARRTSCGTTCHYR